MNNLSQEDINLLIQSATEARKWAYAPYSNYRVGAALMTNSGRIYDGVNVENAAYPSSMCAERNAVFKAVSNGERQFKAIAVASLNGGTPCGACRQVLSEFGEDVQIFIADKSGRLIQEIMLSDLLPGAFSAKDLKIEE